MIADLKTGISGKDNNRLFAELYQQYFAGKKPSQALLDNKEFDFNPEKLTDIMVSYNTDIFFNWEKLGYLAIKRNEIVFFGLYSFDIKTEDIVMMFEDLPFEIASFGTVHPEWTNPFDPYEAPSFGNFHLPHGWACAFKGEGSHRMVSAQWLDHGPWKQYHGKNGMLLIQFHELDIDASTALQQARIAHTTMGITDDGGFIQNNYVYKYDNKGLYDAKEKLLKVVVHGNDISNRQLLDASAAKRYQALGPNMPLNNVAFVFMEEEKAKTHLHSIWLHGLQCRAIIKGKEVVLTEGYDPPVKKPAWG